MSKIKIDEIQLCEMQDLLGVIVNQMDLLSKHSELRVQQMGSQTRIIAEIVLGKLNHISEDL